MALKELSPCIGMLLYHIERPQSLVLLCRPYRTAGTAASDNEIQGSWASASHDVDMSIR
jgi:hypothetical protein